MSKNQTNAAKYIESNKNVMLFLFYFIYKI